MFQEIFLEQENLEPMFVCPQCVDDYMLKELSRGLQAKRICMACGTSVESALTPKYIAELIRKELPNHYMVDDDLYPGYGVSLADVVKNAIGCHDVPVAEAIAENLIDPEATDEEFYWRGQEYRGKPSPFDSEEHQRWYVVGDWDNIANELAHGRRFFNDRARRFFDSLIAEALDAEDPEKPGTPAVVKILPIDTSFYRARIANDASQIAAFKQNPEEQLGAPPKDRAANNRMSPAGVPLLYVSRDVETCIAEVRPSIGDSVAVGRFQSKAPLKLFDFNALSSRLAHRRLSILSPDYEERVNHRLLLEYLHEEIARPARASDNDYIVTQALAEFIRHEKNQNFDGIAFRSVQHEGGVNYVLFDKDAAANLRTPDWCPSFGLKISSDSVGVYRIGAVHYDATPDA